jgi:AhpD family alkylhydroperoxidase
MAAPFPLYNPETAPEASRPVLADVQADFGMIPNLEKVLSASPVALTAYATLWSLFDKTSLSAIERQVVYQTANVVNGCEYCVPWHTKLSEMAGMSPADITALRNDLPLSQSKLEALRRFTREMILSKGHPPEGELDAFFAAGYESVHALEVIVGLATKLISNYTNGIAGTPLDPQVKHLAWSKEKGEGQ